MSCGNGNRFQCGINRFQKHSFTPDRPSNPELHDENQKRLSDLLKMREEQDKGIYQIQKSTSLIVTPSAKNDNTSPDFSSFSENITYTPWSTPSTNDSQHKKS